MDLILNGLPLECTKNVLDAALEVKANYQDYASTINMENVWRESEEAKTDKDIRGEKITAPGTQKWFDSLKAQFEIYGPKFEAIDRLAIVGTGSAPGLICCATRNAMKYLDKCDTIYNLDVYKRQVFTRYGFAIGSGLRSSMRAAACLPGL